MLTWGILLRFAHMLLLTAERAYAHAMSLKASGGEDANALPGSTRREIVSRLNKAAKHASTLVTLLEDKSTTKATDTDLLEAKAYASSLSGAEEFEKHAHAARTSDKEFQRGLWSSCLEQYSTARVIYAALLKSTKKELYKDLLATTIDPAIRFAAYQSHIPRTLAVVTVSRKCFPKDDGSLVKSITKLDPAAFEDQKSASGEDTGAANIPTTITWRGRKAQIPDASIGQALAATSAASDVLIETLEEKPEATAKDKAAAYDDVLIAAQDTADATRHAIEEHEKEGIPESDSRMQDLRVTFLAVTYEMISWRVGRNRVLIGDDDGAALDGPPVKKRKRVGKDGKEIAEKSSKEGNGRVLARLRERVVLFDAILQSIDSVLEVPGAVRDEGFVKEMNGKRDYFRALK
jgi:signal recognition particle subunit SRP68